MKEEGQDPLPLGIDNPKEAEMVTWFKQDLRAKEEAEAFWADENEGDAGE